MSRVSPEFGRIIKEFLQRNQLTFRSAALHTGISAAYWKDMSDGRVPSEEIISRICMAFPELDENELRLSAGYAPKMQEMDAVKAVEFALRSQPDIPDEGKRQILDFVKEIQSRYGRERD
ncbi:MAG: hypothetical protein QHI38_03030 [Armatimonadota bacterium]|nr:hypothetical protein [Armatimonadota bacterium]